MHDTDTYFCCSSHDYQDCCYLFYMSYSLKTSFSFKMTLWSDQYEHHYHQDANIPSLSSLSKGLVSVFPLPLAPQSILFLAVLVLLK